MREGHGPVGLCPGLVAGPALWRSSRFEGLSLPLSSLSVSPFLLRKFLEPSAKAKHFFTGNIVMWVARLSIVDWVYSKILILLVTLRMQNEPRGESYVYLEVAHLFPAVGCVRSKRQYPTVLQTLKLFRWMLD